MIQKENRDEISNALGVDHAMRCCRFINIYLLSLSRCNRSIGTVLLDASGRFGRQRKSSPVADCNALPSDEVSDSASGIWT